MNPQPSHEEHASHHYPTEDDIVSPDNITHKYVSPSSSDSSGYLSTFQFPSRDTLPPFQYPQPVYVLASDGSSLFLIDPTKPPANEEPPPYAPYKPTSTAFSSGSGRRPSPFPLRVRTASESDIRDTIQAVSTESLTLPFGAHSYAVDVEEEDEMARVSTNSLGMSGTGPLPPASTTTETVGRNSIGGGSGGGRRSRAQTVATATVGRRKRSSSDASASNPRRNAESLSGTPVRPTIHFARTATDIGQPQYLTADERTPLLSSPPGSGPRSPTNRSHRSISITSNGGLSINGVTIPAHSGGEGNGEPVISRVRPSSWRNMLRAPSQMGDMTTMRRIQTVDGEAIVVTRPKKKRHWFIGYWQPLISGAHWKALFHLVFLNIPFAVLLWPILVAGTLVGTVLLITLPLGALFWFLTLFLARSACRLELAMQIYFHSPLRSVIPKPVYFPIFQRIKVVEGPSGTSRPVVEVQGSGQAAEVTGVVWERNFMKNAWSMFGDHISYQCLSYLVLQKALVTFLSSIIILVLIPISTALIIPLPGALELVRRFGRWQAGLAVEALQ